MTPNKIPQVSDKSSLTKSYRTSEEIENKSCICYKRGFQEGQKQKEEDVLKLIYDWYYEDDDDKKNYMGWSLDKLKSKLSGSNEKDCFNSGFDDGFKAGQKQEREDVLKWLYELVEKIQLGVESMDEDKEYDYGYQNALKHIKDFFIINKIEELKAGSKDEKNWGWRNEI
jgi:hypothetical protein